MLPNPIIELGPIKVYMYGVCIAIGILLCILVLRFYGKKLKIDSKFLDFLELNAYVSIAVGFFSAALFQAVYNYIDNPQEGFNLFGGMTFLGGLIGGAITFLTIYFIKRKSLTGKFMDVVAIVPCCILIAHAFGRLGCFFAGCCYGIETDSIFGIHFPDVYGKVYPTQLFESIFLFIMFGITSLLCLKKNWIYNFSLYLILYSVFRFNLEFIRGDDRGTFIGLISPSQFQSIMMLIVGVLFTLYIALYYKKNIPLFKKYK